MLKDRDPMRASYWLMKAVAAGQVDAALNLGILLRDSDPVQARRWFEKAAETGHAEAMNSLGILLRDSDPVQARRWFEKAAETGHAEAMNSLGILLRDSDPVQARRWFEKAAETGHAEAMDNLAELVGESNQMQARHWSEKAAAARDAKRPLWEREMTEPIYDVAFSFAGEDRQVARDLATRLLAKNYRVFYDEFYQADLWGADLAERLEAVYGEQSRYCVIVVSENYAAKIWTRHEFRSAMAAALFGGDRDAYILPLRLDMAKLPGLRATIGYLDLANFDLEDVAKLLMQKLGPPPEKRAVEPGEAMGVEEVLSTLYRRSIFTRFHAQLSAEAMFASMSDCRVALQKQIVFVRPREAQRLVASIIAELDLVERAGQRLFTGEIPDMMRAVDGAKLRIIAAMGVLARLSGTPLELPALPTEELFWTLEDADAPPSGPEAWEGNIYYGGAFRG